MIQNIDRFGREWITVTNTRGESFQATQIEKRFYRSHSIGFCGGKPQAKGFLNSRGIPDDNIIYDEYPSGLCTALIAVKAETLTGFQSI